MAVVSRNEKYAIYELILTLAQFQEKVPHFYRSVIVSFSDVSAIGFMESASLLAPDISTLKMYHSKPCDTYPIANMIRI